MSIKMQTYCDGLPSGVERLKLWERLYSVQMRLHYSGHSDHVFEERDTLGKMRAALPFFDFVARARRNGDLVEFSLTLDDFRGVTIRFYSDAAPVVVPPLDRVDFTVPALNLDNLWDDLAGDCERSWRE